MTTPRTRLAAGTVRDLPPIRRDQIRVALADDDPGFREAAAEALRERGLEVVEAVDGATLLAAIRRGGITLVVTDLLMPGLAGSDVIGMCRGAGDAVPFIVVTGAPDAIAELASGTPGVTVLRKPFTRDALLAAVAAGLGLVFGSGEPSSSPTTSTDVHGK